MPRNFALFSRKILLSAVVYFWLKTTVSAQIISVAVESSNISTQKDFLTVLHVSALMLGACASIFWWRRDKTKDEASSKLNSSEDKDKNGVAKKRRSQSSSSAPDENNAEVNANVASWLQNNIGKKRLSNNQLHETSNRKQADNLFKLPDVPAPVEALPISTDQSLLDAIEQIQDFDATEDEREVAINVLLTFKSQNAIEALAQVAHYDESSRLRITALSGLGEFDHDSVFEPILLTCTDPAREVRAAAARTLARLSVNRAEAYTRIVESEDPERLRLASMVCLEAGLANHALARLAHHDKQLSNEAFAMVRLLLAAQEFAPIIKIISNSQDVRAGLILIKALRAIKPIKMLPALYHSVNNPQLPTELKVPLHELIAELTAA